MWLGFHAGFRARFTHEPGVVDSALIAPLFVLFILIWIPTTCLVLSAIFLVGYFLYRRRGRSSVWDVPGSDNPPWILGTLGDPPLANHDLQDTSGTFRTKRRVRSKETFFRGTGKSFGECGFVCLGFGIQLSCSKLR